RKGNTAEETRWMILKDAHGIGEGIKEKLSKEYKDIIEVVRGEEYRRINENSIEINIKEGKDYERLFKELKEEGRVPEKILHLWNITEGEEGLENIERAMEEGYYSIL